MYEDPRLVCPTFCEACRTDEMPIARAREYRRHVPIRRPVCQDNPGAPYIPDPDELDFHIVTAKP